jgi:DNA uptake protein ComE-like DNA-binding protein
MSERVRYSSSSTSIGAVSRRAAGSVRQGAWRAIRQASIVASKMKGQSVSETCQADRGDRGGVPGRRGAREESPVIRGRGYRGWPWETPSSARARPSSCMFAAKSLDINIASADDLETIPGIGVAYARSTSRAARSPIRTRSRFTAQSLPEICENLFRLPFSALYRYR